MKRAFVPFALLPLSLCLLVAGCGDDGGDDGPPPGCTQIVMPAGDAEMDQTAVQEALVAVEDGGMVCFSGDYAFTDELSLSANGVTLRGYGPAGATFDFAAQEFGANGIRVQAVMGITIENLTVKNTPGDGIRVESSTDVVFRNTDVIWDGDPSVDNGAYGLYPVGSTNVLVDGCEVVGARDAGIYVGQSENIIVRNSVAWGNVAGIEIENSRNAEVYGNEAYDNTAGVLVFDLPGLPAGQGDSVRVHDNIIRDNNRDNFAEPGTIVSIAPRGTGMLVLAMDLVEFDNNTVTNNDSGGVLLASWFIAEALGAGTSDDMTYDGYPETIYLHDNTYEGNGAMPAPVLAAFGTPTPAETILWDGVVDETKDNSDGSLSICIQEPDGTTFRNARAMIVDGDLAGVDPVTDITAQDCMHDSIPPVMLSL